MRQRHAEWSFLVINKGRTPHSVLSTHSQSPAGSAGRGPELPPDGLGMRLARWARCRIAAAQRLVGDALCGRLAADRLMAGVIRTPADDLRVTPAALVTLSDRRVGDAW